MEQETRLLEGGIAITIVIPAYNEAARLPRTLQEIFSYFENLGRSFEVVVVDDGSHDCTPLIIKAMIPLRPYLRLITLAQNMGKGRAVKTGVLAAKGEMVLFCDADGATPIAEFARLEKAISNGADIAIGSRARRSAEVKVITHLHRRIIGRVFNFLANLILRLGRSDTQCGFKLFRREAATTLFTGQQEKGFIFDVEILFLARRLKLKVAEVAINWTDQPGSRVRLLSDPWRMFLGMLRIRVRNYRA